MRVDFYANTGQSRQGSDVELTNLSQDSNPVPQGYVLYSLPDERHPRELILNAKCLQISHAVIAFWNKNKHMSELTE